MTPPTSTGITALVRKVIRSRSCSGSIRKEPGSVSARTIFAPTCSMTAAVAVNVYADVMTSSPGPMPSRRSVISIADVAEFMQMVWVVPQ